MKKFPILTVFLMAVSLALLGGAWLYTTTSQSEKTPSKSSPDPQSGARNSFTQGPANQSTKGDSDGAEKSNQVASAVATTASPSSSPSGPSGLSPSTGSFPAKTERFKAPAHWPHISLTDQTGSHPVALHQTGETARVYVQPRAWVEAQLVFPKGQPKEQIRVEILDGGTLENQKSGDVLALGRDRSIRLKAQMSGNTGIHRVRVTLGAESYLLNYWVGPENTYAEAQSL